MLREIIMSNSTPAESTIILGGGIIGLSTAYFMALAQSELHDGEHGPIVVVDPSLTMCAGASGQNEGALGDFGFAEPVLPLAKLSYRLHDHLAAVNDGAGKYGFSEFEIHTVFSHGYDASNPRLPFPVKKQEDPSCLPRWLKIPSTWEAGLIAGAADARRLDPRKFVQFLLDECQRRGVRFLERSTAIRIYSNEENSRLSHIDVQTSGISDLQRLPCHNLVITAGSWSERVFSHLFPKSRLKIPLAQKQTAQNWLRIHKIPKSVPQDHVCQQVFLAPATNNTDIHLSNFLSGDIYVGGPFESPDSLPSTPDDVQIEPTDIETLKQTAAEYISWDSDLELLDSGRAYLPKTTTGLPIITKVNWVDLFPGKFVDSGNTSGGVFLNFGHWLDGFTLAPGSGLLMSQLIRHAPTSIDLTPFALPELFNERL
jgi:glycine/D-amino acid oxidase-like deaminating enzyme